MKNTYLALSLCVTLLSACQVPVTLPTPVPSPTLAPTPEPTATPTLVANTYRLSGQLRDLLPHYAAAPTLTFVGVTSKTRYQAQVSNPQNAGYAYCSDSWEQLYPELSSPATYTMDYAVSDLPQGEDLELTIAYPDQRQYTYLLKAQDIQQTLNISLKQGLQWGEAPVAAKAEVFFKVAQGDQILGTTRVSARSLDPARPYQSEIRNLGAGAFLGVPPETPLEITAEIPNYQPMTRRLRSPAAGHSAEANRVNASLFTPMADENTVSSHLLLTPTQAVTPLAMQKWKGFIRNLAPNMEVRITSLTPAIPFDTQWLSQGETLVTPPYSSTPIMASPFEIDVPRNAKLQITLGFSSRGDMTAFPMRGLLVAQWPLTSTAQDTLELDISPTHFSVSSPDPSPSPASGLLQMSCTLSAIEHTSIRGTVRDAQGNFPSAVEVTVTPLRPQEVAHIAMHPVRILTGNDGQFWFPQIASGVQYQLKATYGQHQATQLIVPVSNKQGDPEANNYALVLN